MFELIFLGISFDILSRETISDNLEWMSTDYDDCEGVSGTGDADNGIYWIHMYGVVRSIYCFFKEGKAYTVNLKFFWSLHLGVLLF